MASKNIDHTNISILAEDQQEIENMMDDYANKTDLELEISFYQISYVEYMRIIDYYINIVDPKNITASNTLDASITLESGTRYRVAINDPENYDIFINKYSTVSNSVIRSHLITIEPSDDVEIMYKERGKAVRKNIKDYNMIVKLTREIPVLDLKHPPILNGNEKIGYRLKHRYSFQLDSHIRLDLTTVQFSSNLNDLYRKTISYEIELEVTSKTSVDNLLYHVTDVVKLIQDADTPISI